MVGYVLVFEFASGKFVKCHETELWWRKKRTYDMMYHIKARHVSEGDDLKPLDDPQGPVDRVVRIHHLEISFKHGTTRFPIVKNHTVPMS